MCIGIKIFYLYYRCVVEEASLKWLAEMCDGDARVALGALELALAARAPETAQSKPAILRLEDIIDGIKVNKIMKCFFSRLPCFQNRVRAHYFHSLDVS